MIDKLAEFENYNSRNNSALYGNDFATYPIRLVFSSDVPSNLENLSEYDGICNYSEKFANDSDNNNQSGYQTYYDSQKCDEMFALKNETPGVVMNSILRFRLIDYYNQTVVTQNGSLCFIEAKSGEDYLNQNRVVSPNLIGFTTTTLINGNIFYWI